MPLYNTAGKGETSTGPALLDALKAISAFAHDSTVPMLNSVKLEASAKDETLTVVATNRYVLGSWTLDWAGDDLDVVLPLSSVKLALTVLSATLKPYRRFDKVPVTLTIEEGSLTRLDLSVFGVKAITVDALDPDYPKWRSLMPSEDNAELSTGQIGLNPTYLALFAKVVAGKSDAIRLTFHGPTKPVLVTTPGGPFKGIVMPVRIGL